MRSSLLLVLLVACLLSVGCGDDGGGDADAGPAALDQCLSSTDRDIIVSRRPTDAGVPDGGADAGEPQQVIYFFEQCVRGPCVDHIFEDDHEALSSCTNECIDETAVSGLSVGCRDCYLDQVLCVTENCITLCLGTTDTACEQCVNEHCTDRLYGCIGY